MNEQQCSPARRVLRQASVANWHGHESHGFLSEAHGFLPSRPPLLALPPSHRQWDEVAAQLPALYAARSVRAALGQLDLLPAGAEALPAPFLLRASTLLSILAHAYVRCDAAAPQIVPPAIRQPWETVSRRLGRRTPVLSYIDLIVYNWRLIDLGRSHPLRVENLRLLVPTVDNQEDRVFYLTQLEILAACTPIVGAIVRAQEAIAQQQLDALEQELLLIAGCLHTVTRSTLPKIDPRARSASYVDPVIWAKTVAPFAVPLEGGVPGPSGTSSPIFHLLDVFFGRRSYASLLGAEMLHLRAWYPRYWRAMLQAVAQISAAEFVARAGARELSRAFDEALRAYAGADGFLGRHRLKVAGYLELAFKAGRNVTIGGFRGLFDDRTWEQVDAALHDARRERVPEANGWMETAAASAAARAAGAAAPTHDVAYDISEVVLHNDAHSGYWLILAHDVFDLSAFASQHPGGFHVLRGYTGMDASAAFRRIGHHAHPGVLARLAHYRIGSVRRLRFESPPDAGPAGRRHYEAFDDVYHAWIQALYLVVELENALHNEYTIWSTAPAGDAAHGTRTPFQLQLAIEVHRRFVCDHLIRLCGDRFAELWAATITRLAPGEQGDWIEHSLAAVWSSAAGHAVELHAETLAALLDQASTVGPASHELLAACCGELERENKRVLHELKLALCDGVQWFETENWQSGSAALLDAARKLPRVLAAYCERLEACV